MAICFTDDSSLINKADPLILTACGTRVSLEVMKKVRFKKA
jgi:hypothetical protein